MNHDTYHHNGSCKWTANILVRAKHELQVPRHAVWAFTDASLIASILVTILLLDNRGGRS